MTFFQHGYIELQAVTPDNVLFFVGMHGHHLGEMVVSQHLYPSGDPLTALKLQTTSSKHTLRRRDWGFTEATELLRHIPYVEHGLEPVADHYLLRDWGVSVYHRPIGLTQQEEVQSFYDRVNHREHFVARTGGYPFAHWYIEDEKVYLRVFERIRKDFVKDFYYSNNPKRFVEESEALTNKHDFVLDSPLRLKSFLTQLPVYRESPTSPMRVYGDIPAEFEKFKNFELEMRNLPSRQEEDVKRCDFVSHGSFVPEVHLNRKPDEFCLILCMNAERIGTLKLFKKRREWEIVVPKNKDKILAATSKSFYEVMRNLVSLKFERNPKTQHYTVINAAEIGFTDVS